MRTPDLEGTLQWYVDTALVRLLAKADELVESGGDELLRGAPTWRAPTLGHVDLTVDLLTGR